MRRGSSGLSLVVGIDKPTGMTSHDVVNRVRRIFRERRVGHAGTLDPLASGVLPILVGPATRLSDHLMGHDKHYIADIRFGFSTDTDDSEGQILRTAEVPAKFFNEPFARGAVEGLAGVRKQLPPVYSALKVDGKKACDEARVGHIVSLKPRDIEIYSAGLLSVEYDDETRQVVWRVSLHVSKGTYIRAIARDLGNQLRCPAHISALRRTRVGVLDCSDCMGVEAVERFVSSGQPLSLNPLPLLGYRIIYPHGDVAKRVMCGNPMTFDDILLSGGIFLFEPRAEYACVSSLRPSENEPADEELFSVVYENKLIALSTYSKASRLFRTSCVFSIGVSCE